MKRIIFSIFLILFTFSCKSKVPQNKIYYEIFVRSYADSNGDGIGDLTGIKNKLHVLKDMGIEAIWLTPIFKSPSYHKYDVTNYYSIDEEYGSLDDLKELVESAHFNGIKVILDLPVNHTSDLHPWFLDVKNNKESKYRKYYQIRNKNEKGINFNAATLGGNSWHKLNEDEMYFGVFWAGMPDLNFENKELRKEINKIAKYWIKEANIDGYRIDAAPHIYAYGEFPKGMDLRKNNIEWWKEFRKNVKKAKKDAYIVGEVWESSESIARYFEVFDSNFNFELATKGIFEAISKENASVLNSKIERIHNTYSKVNENFIDAIFLSNHDMSRSAEILKTLEKRKLAASILLTLPGNPFIYYGEELGMLGIKPDEKIREPYIWGDRVHQTTWQENEYNKETEGYIEQRYNEDSLLTHYINWIKIRKENEELRYGKYVKYIVDNDKVFSFKMNYKGKEVIVLHNLSDKDIDLKLDEKMINLKPYESKIIK